MPNPIQRLADRVRNYAQAHFLPAKVDTYQAPPTPRGQRQVVSSAGSFFGAFGGAYKFIPTPYNPDTLVQKKGLKTYRTMVTDEQVKAALNAKKYAVLSTGYEIQLAQLPEGEEDEQADYAEEHRKFVEFNFQEMAGSFESKILSLMGALEFGYAVQERELWHIDFGDFEGKWGIKNLLARPQEDIEFQIDSQGNLTKTGVWQFGVPLPADKFVIYSHDVQYHGHYYGNSDLRSVYRCYSDDTQILAESGWKNLSAVTMEDRVATLNPETGFLEYQYPTQLYAYPYKGKMFHQGGRFIDFLVTPNHEMWAKGENENEFRTIPVTELPRHVNYKRDAKWVGNEPSHFSLPEFLTTYQIGNAFGHNLGERRYYQSVRDVPMESWLRLFGIWIAEGCTWQRKDGNRQRVISITQNRGPKLETIKQWIKDCGFSFYEHKRNNSKVVNLEISNAQLFEYLKQFGGSYDKFIPHELKQLSPRLLRILWESMMLGDGRGDSMYCTVSKQLADDVSEIILKMGYAPTTHFEPQLTNKFGTNGIWIVSCNRRRIERTRCNEHKDRREWVTYDGMVYCLEVPNHLVYVRRNGKSAWSRNSFWQKDNVMKLMLVALERYAEPIAVATYKGLISTEDHNTIDAFLKNLQSRSGVTLPENIAIDFKTPTPRSAEAFIPVLNQCDQAIRIGIMMPGLMGLSGESQTGSYARAIKEFDVFLWILGQLRRELETVVNEQIVKPLIDLNYEVEHGQYPTFKFKEVTEEARQRQFELFLMGLGAGALNKGPEDENKLRDLINFEPLPDDFVPPSPFGLPPLGMNGGAPENGNEAKPPPAEEPEEAVEKSLARMTDGELREYATKGYHLPDEHDQQTHGGDGDQVATPKGDRKANLRIIKTKISDRLHPTRADTEGFLIVGTNALGHSVRIAAKTREIAEKLRDKVRRGEPINAEDFQ